jgi:hypothetical protein
MKPVPGTGFITLLRLSQPLLHPRGTVWLILPAETVPLEV